MKTYDLNLFCFIINKLCIFPAFLLNCFCAIKQLHDSPKVYLSSDCISTLQCIVYDVKLSNGILSYDLAQVQLTVQVPAVHSSHPDGPPPELGTPHATQEALQGTGPGVAAEEPHGFPGGQSPVLRAGLHHLWNVVWSGDLAFVKEIKTTMSIPKCVGV